MALLGMTSEFWQDRSVLVTGHTGFKGGWLSLWLQRLGARLHGYALEPNTRPALFDVAHVGAGMAHRIGDLADSAALCEYMESAQPELVIHLAAQALVKEGYRDPVGTIATNVLGTAHLLEAVRRTRSVKALLVITSDKCYENREWLWPYRENEPLGGHDPYSASKACQEIITAAWRNSYQREGLTIATARAGNVIGGGDWAADRLVPDAIRAWEAGDSVRIRYPNAIRPWQHVLEPLHGYLLLAERLHRGECAGAWNFGPNDEDMQPVANLLGGLADRWDSKVSWVADSIEHAHEAGLLRLDSSKARAQLNWRPKWRLGETLERIARWQQALRDGADMRAHCISEIADYEATP